MTEKPVGSGGQDIDERFRALLNNANAARVVSQAVEGTIGPKGLDTMMVDNFGDVVITNDGVTILTLMEVNHPAARMLIKAARAQQLEVGDGTTTTTLLASALITEGCEQVLKGVPVTKVIEGIEKGMEHVIDLTFQHASPVVSLEDPAAFNIALVAGRGDRELSELAVTAARLIGEQQLIDREFKLSDSVKALEGVENEVFSGIIINRDPVNRDMPAKVEQAKILVIDDALGPEDLGKEARGTEAGLKRSLELRRNYASSLHRLKETGVNVILVDQAIDDLAEEVLTEAGIMVIQRVSHRELTRVCEHTGARMIKRTGINRDPEFISGYLGRAGLVQNTHNWGHTRICSGESRPVVTILVGGATEEVVNERERMARDAVASLQAALRGGVVPGGGAFEVWLATQVTQLAREAGGMTSYGMNCVKEALIRPFASIVVNAGFNPLEKLEEVMSAQSATGNYAIGVDCSQGVTRDMMVEGVVDPALVKIHAFKAAKEVARAILRISTIVKKVEVVRENEIDFLRER